jgi:hypothetical protein
MTELVLNDMTFATKRLWKPLKMEGAYSTGMTPFPTPRVAVFDPHTSAMNSPHLQPES